MYFLSSSTTTAGNPNQLKLTHSHHSHSSPFSFPRMVSPESCSERKTVSTSTLPINALPPGLLRVVSDSDVNEQLQVNNTNNLNHSRRRQSSSIAMMIRPQDIICGRDSKAFNHPGNRQFRSFIAGHLTEYNAATSRTERGIVIQQVLYMVQNELGARFVKKQEGSSSDVYVELTAKEAREKVGHSLRDKSVFRNQQQQQQQQQHQRQQPTGCRIVDNKSQKKKKSKKKAVTSQRRAQPDPVTSSSSSLPSSTNTSSSVPTHQSAGTFFPSAATSSNSKSLAEEFFHATSPLDFLPINHTQQDLSQLESLENLLDFEETFAAGFDDIDMIAAEQSSAHEGDDLNVDNHHYDCGI